MKTYAIGVDYGTEAGRALLVDISNGARVREDTFQPIAEHTAVYDKLYAEYCILHDYFGRGSNPIMKRLKHISETATRNKVVQR